MTRSWQQPPAPLAGAAVCTAPILHGARSTTLYTAESARGRSVSSLDQPLCAPNLLLGAAVRQSARGRRRIHPAELRAHPQRSDNHEHGQAQAPTARSVGSEVPSELAPAQSVKAMKATRTFNELHHIVSAIGADLTPQQLAAALARAARGRGTYNTWDTGSADFAAFLDALAQHLPQVLPGCDACTASKVLRAWSKLQYVNAGMLSACLQHFCQPGVLSTASSADCAYVVHALAVLVDGDDPTASAAVQAALQHTPDALSVCVQRYSKRLIDEDKPRYMSALLWGLATLAGSGQAVIAPAAMQAMHQTPGVLLQCLDGCLATATKASSQSIADTLWALASLADSGHPAVTAVIRAAMQRSPGAVPALLARFCKVLGSARDQAVSAVLWSLAKLQVMPEAPRLSQLIVAVDAAATRLNAKDRNDTLWALNALQQLWPPDAAAA